MITVVTDVVRENNQTYRLGYTEQCKDASKMGVGCPEYILLFRKLPSDTSTAYADEPVIKSKSEYSLAQWQLDAHAFWKSSGDRLLHGSELAAFTQGGIQTRFKDFCDSVIYDYNGHVDHPEIYTDGKKAMLDELHKRKIDLADRVLVLNVGGYIGDSTRSEIEHERSLCRSRCQ